MKFLKPLITSVFALSIAGFALATQAASDTIRVVTDPTFPPMEFEENGQKTGFDIDIMNALARAMGKKVEWTAIDFKGLIPAIISGRADAADSAIYITKERAQVVDFTDPYYVGGLVVLTKDNSPIRTLKDLGGKRVTVQVGTKSVNYMHEHYPKVNLVEVEKNQEMFNLVNIGRSDAAVTGKPAAKLFAQKNPGFRVLDEQVTNEEYGIAVSKNEPELTKGLNEALKTIKANGTYQKIVDKWFESKK